MWYLYHAPSHTMTYLICVVSVLFDLPSLHALQDDTRFETQEGQNLQLSKHLNKLAKIMIIAILVAMNEILNSSQYSQKLVSLILSHYVIERYR